MKLKFLFTLLCLPGLHLNAMQPQASKDEPERVAVKTRKSIAGNVSYSDWKPFDTRLVKDVLKEDELSGKNSPRNLATLLPRSKATGFYRTEKIDDRWWIIQPDGCATLSVGVTTINHGASERNKTAFKEKFASNEDWTQKTIETLQQSGFNTAGAWSDYKKIIKYNTSGKQPLAYTIILDFMSSYGKQRGGTRRVPGHTGYPGDVIFVFDPEFEIFCDNYAKKLAENKNDPNLIGYFSDNEMPFNLRNLEGYLKLENPNDYGTQAAQKWLDSMNISPADISDRDRAAFLAYEAKRYFSIVSAAIRKYDPNHMYLGSRFYSSEKNVREFMQVAGQYIDLISINYYGAWTPNEESMHNWTKWSGKPFMVTEFYTKAEDSGLPNISGAGWIVKTQADRGKFYQNYCLGLLAAKNCVGWHWFKYQDNDPTNPNAELSNTDANKGIVDNYYNYYEPLLSAMRELNLNYPILIQQLDKEN